MKVQRNKSQGEMLDRSDCKGKGDDRDEGITTCWRCRIRRSQSLFPEYQVTFTKSYGWLGIVMVQRDKERKQKKSE